MKVSAQSQQYLTITTHLNLFKHLRFPLWRALASGTYLVKSHDGGL